MINEKSLQEEWQHFMTNDVFATKKVKTQQQNK